MGGFSAMIGNPPWERPRVEDKEWWSMYPSIANAKKSTRLKMINELRTKEPMLVTEYENEIKKYDLLKNYFSGGQFPLTGHGSMNLYGLFAEIMVVLSKNIGLITQTNLVTDAMTHRWFKQQVLSKRISGIVDFVNKKPFFKMLRLTLAFQLSQ